jgi:type I restriction enzyme S subunit
MNADRLLALYEKVAEAPGAVPRLRRFVLDLAVRGKLVPQEAGDEPASDLLKRIFIARENTPTSCRRASKKRVDPSLAELQFALPSGWSEAKLSELVRVVNGRAYKKPELLEAGTPVLRVGNLFTSDHWYYSNLELEEDKYCDEGDLIYAWSASFGPFIWDGPRVIYHYHIWKLPLFSEANLDKQFLYLFLQQKTREIKDAGHGISMVHMTKEKMEQLAVPLPPLAEQRRIVGKVEELMALLDRLEAARGAAQATRDRLTAASLARLTAPDADAADLPANARFALTTLPALTSRPDQIKPLRQTILNLAVRGKLVEQDPNDEPVTNSLAAISAKRDDMVRKKKLRREKPLKPVQGVDAPFQIPSTWQWVRVGELSLFTQYGTSAKAAPSEMGIPVLTMGNIQEGAVVRTNEKRIPETSDELPGLYLKDFDLLYNRTNSAELVGKTGVYRGDDDCLTFASYLIRIRLSADHTSPIYVNLAMNAPDFRETQIVPHIKKQTGQANVSGSALKNMLIPLPPLAEQHRIVAKVDALMALCDRLEAALTTADTTRARLLEGLLADALNPASMQEMEAAE